MDVRRGVIKTLWSCVMVASFVRLPAMVQGAPLSSVTIWNSVGEPILVHCHDVFRDLEQQEVPDSQDYVFTFFQNPDGTTLYSCSFVWGLNKSQEFSVWEGDKAQTNSVKNCGANSFKCLYKVTKEGFYMASGALGHPTLSNWLFINPWTVRSKVKA